MTRYQKLTLLVGALILVALVALIAVMLAKQPPPPTALIVITPTSSIPTDTLSATDQTATEFMHRLATVDIEFKTESAKETAVTIPPGTLTAFSIQFDATMDGMDTQTAQARTANP